MVDSMIFQPNHIADSIRLNPLTNTERRSRPISNNAAWELEPEKYPPVMSRLERAGFGEVFKMGRITNIPDLVEALIERWRPERNCFDLPSGEKTITLEDVSYITGLSIDGDVVTNEFTSLNVFYWCGEYLPGIPPNVKPHVRGNTVTFAWLKGVMSGYLENCQPTEDMYDRYTRGLILLLISGIMMPHPESNKVYLMYLPLVTDFNRASTFSWGAATLSWLYRALYKSTKNEKSQFAGCSHLLYVWFWLRWPSLAPTPRTKGSVPQEYLFPLAARYGRVPRYFDRCKNDDLPWIRSELEKRDMREFVWRPYCEVEVPADFATRASRLGRAKVPLICFFIVEFQYPDRVMRQFDLRQTVPPGPIKSTEVVNALRKLNMQGNELVNWADILQDHIAEWNRRHEEVNIITGVAISNPILYWPSYEYKRWFERAGLPFFWPNRNYPPVHTRRRIVGKRNRHEREMDKRLQKEDEWMSEPLPDYKEADYPVDYGSAGSGSTSDVPGEQQAEIRFLHPNIVGYGSQPGFANYAQMWNSQGSGFQQLIMSVQRPVSQGGPSSSSDGMHSGQQVQPEQSQNSYIPMPPDSSPNSEYNLDAVESYFGTNFLNQFFTSQSDMTPMGQNIPTYASNDEDDEAVQLQPPRRGRDVEPRVIQPARCRNQTCVWNGRQFVHINPDQSIENCPARARRPNVQGDGVRLDFDDDSLNNNLSADD